jgi:hypothetical protein
MLMSQYALPTVRSLLPKKDLVLRRRQESCRGRKVDNHGCASARVAVDSDVSTMSVCDSSADSQAKSGSTALRCEEGAEDAWFDGLCYSRPGVGNFDYNPLSGAILAARDRDVNLARSADCLDGVLKNIQEQLLQL